MSFDTGIFLPVGGGFTGVIPLIRPLLAIPERSAGVGDGWVPSLWWRTLAHPVLDFHLPLSVARASTAQCKCPPLICLILHSISVGDQRTDGLEAQLFVLEIIQFFQETVPELAGPSVDFELYIGMYTGRADMGKPGGGVI